MVEVRWRRGNVNRLSARRTFERAQAILIKRPGVLLALTVRLT